MRPQGMKWIWHATRLAIYLRDGFACVYCGERAEDAGCALDHVEDPTDNAPDNLVTSCGPCNSRKGGFGLRSWLRRRARLGEDPQVLEAIRQRVAAQTFQPLDRKRARRLLAARASGPGSFAALAELARRLEREDPEDSCSCEVTDAA